MRPQTTIPDHSRSETAAEILAPRGVAAQAQAQAGPAAPAAQARHACLARRGTTSCQTVYFSTRLYTAAFTAALEGM